MSLHDPDYPRDYPYPNFEVTVVVESDRGHDHRPKGQCDNCGGPTNDDPIYLAIVSLEDPESLDELCSWGCVLELSASVVAVAGGFDDLRPNITIKELNEH